MKRSLLKNIDELGHLPESWPEALTECNRNHLVENGPTLVVLDDDPTGTQTVYDVPVLTQWDDHAVETMVHLLQQYTPVVFVLTNTRAMNEEETRSINFRIVSQLKEVSERADRQIEIISRSDSTLRGHFPLETDVIAEAWPEQADIVLVMPFFAEGGRVTIHGQHYVTENDKLIPAHETPFAHDAVFGFQNSWLPDWIEEKTAGDVKSDDVVLIPIGIIREQGPSAVAAILNAAAKNAVCVADSVTDHDAEVVAAGVARCDRVVLARSAASWVRVRAGLAKQDLLSPKPAFPELNSHGGLVIVGSHVPKTTTQFKHLLYNRPTSVAVEVSVADLLDDPESVISQSLESVSSNIKKGRDVVLYTSRELIVADDDQSNLDISKAVSACLVEIVKQLSTCPRFLIAKGGITSSDVATKGLNIKQAVVAGSILPGVPVWTLGSESKFPGLSYIVFPGNVGGDNALTMAVERCGINR
jgi:uncharacterized protein YgbK (DUF1537 family)